MELWAVGYYTTIGAASTFAGDATSPCLADYAETEDSAFAAFGANIDDVFIIDREGQVRYRFTVAEMDLGSSDNRDKVDRWVRKLLEE